MFASSFIVMSSMTIVAMITSMGMIRSGMITNTTMLLTLTLGGAMLSACSAVGFVSVQLVSIAVGMGLWVRGTRASHESPQLLAKVGVMENRGREG